MEKPKKKESFEDRWRREEQEYLNKQNQDTVEQQPLLGSPSPANNQKVVPKVGAVTSGMTGMSGMTQGIPTDLIKAIPAHQPDPSVVKTPKPAELPKPKSLNTVTKTKFDELSPAEAAASKPASISTLPYKDRAAAWDRQFAGKKVQVGNYQMALPTFGELQTHALNPTFAAWAEQAGAGKISDDGMFYPYTSTGEIGSHPTFRITQQNGQMQSVPVRYYDPLNTLTLGALGQSGVQPLPQPESNEGFLTGIARGLAQPFVGINKAGVNIGANYGRDAQDKQYLTDANSVLNPTFQSGAGRFIGETASTLPLAAGTAGVGTGLARMVGLGKGLSSVVGGVGAGAALGAAPNINEVYAGGQTPSQAAVNTALGGVGGGISGGAGYNIFKSAMNPAVKVGLQAATDFGIGTATPFASAAINNTQMPTLGQAVQSGAMNMLPTLAMGIGGIRQGMKRNQQKINTQTAVKDAVVNEATTNAAIEQQKQQDIQNSFYDIYGSVRSTSKGKGKNAFEDIIGVSTDNFNSTSPEQLQSSLNSTVENLGKITGKDLTKATDSEIGKTIGEVYNNPVAANGSPLHQAITSINSDIQSGNVQLSDVAKDLGLPSSKFYTDLIKKTSDGITEQQLKVKQQQEKVAKEQEKQAAKVQAEQAKIAAEAQKQAELAQQALAKQQAREALPGLIQQVQNPPLGVGTEILHIADLLEGKANFDTGLPVNKNIELATKKVVKSIEETGIDATLKQIEFNKVELKAKLDLKRAAEAEKVAKSAEKAKPKEAPKTEPKSAEPVKKKEQTLKVTKVTKPKAEPKQKGRPQKQASSNADPDIAKAVNKWSDTMIKQVSDGIAFPELKGITTHAELESAATKAVEAGAYDLEGKQLTVPEYLDDAAKRAVQYSKKRKPTESKRAQKKKEAPPIVEETNIQSIGGEDVSTAGIDATEISGFTIKSNDTSYKRTEKAADALRKLITMRLDKGDNLWDIYSDLTKERASAGLKGKMETVQDAPDWWVDIFSEFQDRNENYIPDALKNIVNGYKKAQSNLRGSERGVNYIIAILPTIAGAALTGYGLYHALTTGDVGGFHLAAIGGFTNPNLLKGVVENTKNWLSNRRLNDNLGNPFSRWREMNPDATIAERQKGFAEIKQEGADRIKGIAGLILKPLEFVDNTYVNSIRKAGDKFDSYFTEKVMPLEQKYQDWITKYDVNPDLVNQVAELNVKVWDKAAEVMNDADIPVSERADEMKEEVRLMLNKEFRGKPELKSAYEAYRKAIDALSAVELEQKALATVGWMPDEVAANEKKFMKIADDFYYGANKLEDRIKEIKGMSGGKKAFDELVQTDAEFASLYGDKAQGRKLSDKRADEYINDYTESIQTSADKLTASGDDADKLANFSLNLREQIKMSKDMNYLPYWKALKSGMRKTYTLQRAGDENKRYRIYSKNKKGKNKDLASIVRKERLTMHLPDGTTLTTEEAANSLEQNQTQEGAYFTSPDGTEWHITEYDSNDDNYTSGLYNAMNVFLDALSSGAAGGKLSKLAGEWLNNHKDITNDTAEGRKLRKVMQDAAEGNVDYETLKTNIALLKAQAMDDLHKTSTKASPAAVDKGRDIVRGVGEHFSGISTDAERIGQTIQTSQLQIESTLKGFNDKLTALLNKHQEQLASRTARPFFRNSIYDALTELSGIGQALVLGGNVKSGVVNVVKGSNAAISEYGFNPKSKIKTDTAKTAFNVGMEAVKPLMQLRARRRYHIDAQRFEKFKEVTSFMIAKSQDMADNFTARLATADFVSKLSEADQKALANGDAKLISDLKSAVQRGVRRTQGSFRHYNLSPMQQGLLRLPLGSAILAFTAPRINELNYVYHQIRNIKNPENFAKLARYATMTILTVGAMGLPLVTEMRGLLEAGTGDREETDYDKMLGKLKDLAKEQGVPDAWIDNARAMTEKGALANQFTNTDLMNDDALTSMANIFGVGYAANIIKSTSENFNNEDKTAAEKVLSVMAGTNPLLKGVYRGTMEATTGQKTDSKISVVPGSTADVESVVRHTLNIPSHSEAEKIRRIKHIDLTTEDGLFNAASDMIKDVQGMSTLAYKGRYITSSGKEANMDALRNMQNELIKEPDKLRSVIRKANEITADRAEDIEQTKDDLLAWLKSTDASSVKGLHTTFRKGGNMEELLNKALNGKDNPGFNSTSGIVKSIIGSPDDDKYRETSVYGMYRKKAIIEALKDSGLGIIATWKPTTKLADNQRLSGVPDKQQALEYAKNRIINLINTSTVRVTP